MRDRHRRAATCLDKTPMGYIQDTNNFDTVDLIDKVCTPVEAGILKGRMERRTLKNLGKMLKLSQERVRQIESRGLGNLRKYLNDLERKTDGRPNRED
jgi:DNA-directed RNA polymerase sigma subunit (sigma70/sigma32)